MVEATAARLDPSRRRRATSSAALSPSDSNANANANANADAGAAAAERKPNPKPKLKAVASRYLTPFSSSSKPTSTSSSSSTTTSTRRSPSPAPRRPVSAAAPASGSGTATRTFSVAFQTPTYSLDTSKVRPVSPSVVAAIAEQNRRSKNVVAAPRGKVSDVVRWPTAASAVPYASDGGALTKTGAAHAASILAAVRPTARRASVDGAEYLHLQALSSDTESGSSGGWQDGGAGAGAGVASRAHPSPRSITNTSARFTVGSRSDRFADQATPFPTRISGAASSSPRTAPVKKKSLFNKNTEYCSSNKKGAADSILAAVRSTASDETTPRRASVDGPEYLQQGLSSDTESGSSGGSQAGAGAGVVSAARPSPRSIMSSSARFFTGSRSERFAGLPRTSGVASSSPRTAAVKKKSLFNTFLSSPFGRSSPKQPSPIKPAASSPRRPTSPSPAIGFPGKLDKRSSHCNLDSDMRRKGHGDHRAEEEHLLRTLYSRHLQWRRANAQAAAALSAQTLAAEKHLCGAWIAILRMRRSVALRKIQLQLFRNDCKLMAILRGQMINLEKWSLLEKEHADSLSGIVGALNATILRLPVSDGAVADIKAVKNAVGSAVDVMQTIGNSTSTLMSKLALATASGSQLSRIAVQERALVARCRELLFTLASMHVKYCSLQGQRVQLTKRRLRHF